MKQTTTMRLKSGLVALALVWAGTAQALEDAARTIEMQVDGLVCAFCAQGISKKLGQLPATADVLVSLESGLVAVALKPGGDIGDDTLRSTLTEAGYSVKRIERKTESLEAVRTRLKAQP